MSDIAQFWDIQWEQQQLWHDWNALSQADRESLAKDLLLHAFEELGELQKLSDRTKYHIIKRKHDVPTAALAEAGVDLFKLIIALMLLGGVNAQQFIEEFTRKTAVVKSKWEWECADLQGVDVLLCDLDGCVVEWTDTFTAWAQSRGADTTNINHPSLESLKDEFHGGGGFAGLPAIDGAIEVLNRWRDATIADGRPRRLIMVTARPYKRHRRIYSDTTTWLKDQGLRFDHIMFEGDKAEAVRSVQPARIIAHIEDRGKHALEVASTGTRVLKLPFRATEERVAHPLITEVADWKDIQTLLR